MARSAAQSGKAGAAKAAATDRSSAVYEGLRRAIIEQALQPGDKLPEDMIGESFGVSRTLVRNALTRLEGEGLVELRRNRGAVVASPSLASAHDIFDVRRQLEDLVVQRLSGRIDPAQAAALYAHVERERSAHGRDGPESIRLSGEFHMLLAEMTGNALLARYVSELASRSSLILALYGRPHSSECAVTEHVELIEALVAGRSDEARRLMSHHIGAVQGRALIRSTAEGESNLMQVLGDYVRKAEAAR